MTLELGYRYMVQVTGGEKYINVNLEQLWHAANIRGWVTWDPVQQEGGEPLLEEN